MINGSFCLICSGGNTSASARFCLIIMKNAHYYRIVHLKIQLISAIIHLTNVLGRSSAIFAGPTTAYVCF